MTDRSAPSGTGHDTARPRRLLSCIEEWPDCESGEYHPSCCRFPKSCSCRSYSANTPESELEPVAVPGPASVSPAERTGVELIAAERQRQIEVEGWTPEHDDIHDRGEMARAAACYAIPNDDAEEPVLFPTRSLIDGATIPPLWPWGRSWYKRTPYDRKRELVKAGALIAAELDRLQRNPDDR